MVHTAVMRVAVVGHVEWIRFARVDRVPATGQIELQNHTSPLYFKNIYIKELPSSEK
mgnify:CR=1 FL=1